MRTETALPAGGQGDRSSREKGSGIEFAEHRPYQPGDDLKHVDPYLEARLGEAYIRQYSVDAQLPVTILIDCSASMEVGHPDKLRFAAGLAAAISFLALSGNDRVRLGALQSGKPVWTSWFNGVRSVERILSWLETMQGRGTARLNEAVQQAAANLPPTGLVIIISDWQAEDPGKLLATLGGLGRQSVGVHLYTPAEEDPSLLQTSGDLRLIDAETGEEMDVAMNPQALEQYRAAWQRFTEELRLQLLSQQTLYVPVSTDTTIEDVLLKDWTRLGLILR